MNNLSFQLGVKTMSIKKIALHLALAGIGAGICNIAFAADEDGSDQTATLEEVVVTG